MKANRWAWLSLFAWSLLAAQPTVPESPESHKENRP